IVRGRTKPSLALLSQIRSVFSVSTEWLITGVGDSPKTTLEGFVKESTPPYQPHPGGPSQLKGDNKVALPLLSEAQVLSIYNKKTYIKEIKAEEYCLFYRDWLSQPDETICTEVRGSEMEPLLKDGSVVALNISLRDPTLLVGRICGIWVKGMGGGGATPDKICFRWLKASEPYLVFIPQQEGHSILCLPTAENPIVGRVEGAWVRF
ncbi:MAG TPA: hypothetical protein ACFYED_10450, partial [Candidatus Tripitaka californicus]